MTRLATIACLFFMLQFHLWGQTQTLEGQVLDTDTKYPLRAVELRLMRGEEILQTAKTDKDGRYKFLVEPAVYDLGACKQGYVFQTYRSITAWAGLENEFNVNMVFCRGLCGEEVYETPKAIFRQNETGTNARFSGNEIRRGH